MKRYFIICLLAVCAMIGGICFAAPDPYAHLDCDRFIRFSAEDIMPVAVKAEAVTEDDVSREISKRLGGPDQVRKNGPAKNGDLVRISYYGLISGEPYEGNSAQRQSIIIGRGTNEDFERAVTGKKAGAVVTAEKTFPSDHPNRVIAGKTVGYQIYVESVHRFSKRVYDENYVKENTGYKSVKEYEAAVRKELEKKNERSAEQKADEIALSRLLSSAEFVDYPKDLIREEAHARMKLYHDIAVHHNMEWDEYLCSCLRTEEKAFNKMIAVQASEIVKEKLVIYKIAKDNELRLSEKEYREWKKRYEARDGCSKKEILDRYGIAFTDFEQLADLRYEALKEKVLKRKY